MNFNRQKFWNRYREEFGSVTPVQKPGIERLLTGFETYYGWWNSVYKIANALAQVKLETANSFMPVQEGYYLAKGVPFDRNYFQGNYPVVQKFRKSLTYFPFDGKGDIQLTHNYNYADQTVYLHRYFPEVIADFERRTGQTFDLLKHPEQMFDGQISFCVLTVGMNRGTFTGKGFFAYKENDYFNMRSIVNGDKNKTHAGETITIGEKVKINSGKFEKILKFALEKETTPANVGEYLDSISTDQPDGAAATHSPQGNPSTTSVEKPSAPSVADNAAGADDSNNIDNIVNTVPTQTAENITNVQTGESKTPPGFVAENKEIPAPASEGTTATATTITVAGIVIPGFIVGIIKAIQDAVTQGYVSASDVGNTVIGFISSNQKYVFILIGLIIVVLIVKKLSRQVTLWIQMFIAADPNKHDVTVIPFAPPSEKLTLMQRLRGEI